MFLKMSVLFVFLVGSMYILCNNQEQQNTVALSLANTLSNVKKEQNVICKWIRKPDLLLIPNNSNFHTDWTLQSNLLSIKSSNNMDKSFHKLLLDDGNTNCPHLLPLVSVNFPARTSRKYVTEFKS